MLAENEYGWQTIRKNTKRINIWRDFHFKEVLKLKRPTNPDIVETSSCIYTIPNETSVITIQTLTTDDDGGLLPNDAIAYGIEYTTTTSNGSTKIHLDAYWLYILKKK